MPFGVKSLFALDCGLKMRFAIRAAHVTVLCLSVAAEED
jgi:hypothetical protein